MKYCCHQFKEYHVKDKVSNYKGDLTKDLTRDWYLKYPDLIDPEIHTYFQIYYCPFCGKNLEQQLNNNS